MSESAEIAKIHYRYQVGENRERQDNYAKRKFAPILLTNQNKIKLKFYSIFYPKS